MLPPSDFFVRRETVFNQQELQSRFQNPRYLRERSRNIGSRAQCPGRPTVSMLSSSIGIDSAEPSCSIH